ncbi:MAG: hypothetical protein JWM91_4893 [Rhodospirillales bacterium]|nr:hypothetical protein [Rhodospirillales bacterium]
MKDYGADFPCPECGAKHHATPRQLQTDLQIAFICARCGHHVVAENAVANKIFGEMDAIKSGLEKIKVWGTPECR